MERVPESQSWNHESEIAADFFRFNGFLYGQGFWGDSPREKATGEADLGQDLFKQALSGTKVAVHSMSSNVIGTIDNDDFYEYLGGTALAVRTLDGKSPDLYVTDLSHPKEGRQTPLAQVVGQEMRTRYLNPAWIKRMTAEGYAGDRFISDVVEYLWGWQVTAPEVVGGEKWQELYETYVEDKYVMGIKESFRKSGNPWAHQVIMARMLEAVRKEYWKPDRRVVEAIAQAYAENAVEHGMACALQTCNNPQLAAMTESTLRSVPGLEPLAEKFTKTLQGVTVSAGAKQAASQSPKANAKSAPKSAEVKPVAEKPAATKPAPPGVQAHFQPSRRPSQ